MAEETMGMCLRNMRRKGIMGKEAEEQCSKMMKQKGMHQMPDGSMMKDSEMMNYEMEK